MPQLLLGTGSGEGVDDLAGGEHATAGAAALAELGLAPVALR